ncbi:MAG: Ig-like domain-containing protein, partial [Vicinamibacteria bacterium]
VGTSNTCLGPMSACTQSAPVAGSNLTPNVDGTTIAFVNGDADVFVDNCEVVDVSVPVTNVGTVAQTNVRVLSVQPLSHPGMAVYSTTPAVALATCATAAPGFRFRAVDLLPGDVVRFRVDFTSDQLAPGVRSAIVQLGQDTEGNFQLTPSRTFDFETDLEGFAVSQGTFTRATAGGGAGGSAAYVRSSTAVDSACDEVVTPLISLTPTSTLSLQNNYTIEPSSGGVWYDRANVGLREAGARTVVSPSSGRTYNATGASGTCVGSTPGWAGTNATWGASTWTAADLGAAAAANRPLRVSAMYATDGSLSLNGFRFDRLTLTDFNLKVADTLPDQCAANQAPVAVADVSNSPTPATVVIDVLANDSDPDRGQCLRIASVTTPANGTATINVNSCVVRDTVTYTPSPACGPPCSDSFQYTVSDQNGGTATTTVSVSQQPVELQGFKVE